MTGRLEHVKRSVDVDLIGREGILNGPRDGPECALVEYHFDVLSRLANNLEIPQVALDVIDKVEVGIEIFSLACGVVVEDADRMALIEQGTDKKEDWVLVGFGDNSVSRRDAPAMNGIEYRPYSCWNYPIMTTVDGIEGRDY